VFPAGKKETEKKYKATFLEHSADFGVQITELAVSARLMEANPALVVASTRLPMEVELRPNH
jgi:hypothetical protein